MTRRPSPSSKRIVCLLSLIVPRRARWPSSYLPPTRRAPPPPLRTVSPRSAGARAVPKVGVVTLRKSYTPRKIPQCVILRTCRSPAEQPHRNHA